MEKSKIIKRIDSEVRNLGYLVLACLIMLSYFFYQSVKFEESYLKTKTKLRELKVRHGESVVSLVRKQLELILDGTKNSIITYLENNDMKGKLAKRDANNNVIFYNKSGQTLSFIPTEMFLNKNANKLYDIFSRNDNMLIMKDSFPEYNDEYIRKLAKVTSGNFKAFGPTGDTFWYVPETLLLVYDESSDCAPSTNLGSDVVLKDDKIFLDDIPKHPSNLNSKATDYVIQKKYRWIADSTPEDNLTFFFSEPKLLGEISTPESKDDSNDFRKYPFGEYNREFQARRVIKTATLGLENVYGIELRVVIVLGAQEPEIAESFKSYESANQDVFKTLEETERLGVLYPTIVTGIAALIALICLFGFKNLEKKYHLEMIDELDVNKEKEKKEGTENKK